MRSMKVRFSEYFESKLTRLRLIIFQDIHEQIEISSITSFSLKIKKTTTNNISSILTQKNMHTVELDRLENRLSCELFSCLLLLYKSNNFVYNRKSAFRRSSNQIITSADNITYACEIN